MEWFFFYHPIMLDSLKTTAKEPKVLVQEDESSLGHCDNVTKDIEGGEGG